MVSKTLIIIGILCLFQSIHGQDMLFVLTREGPRGPLDTMFDTNNQWKPEDVGEVTGNGLRMQYVFGSTLAEKYP